jgi:hypothetical protein
MGHGEVKGARSGRTIRDLPGAVNAALRRPRIGPSRQLSARRPENPPRKEKISLNQQVAPGEDYVRKVLSTRAA